MTATVDQLTPAEMRSRLLEADALLAYYKKLLEPVLSTLAVLKGQATGNRYSGNFGCWEEGVDTLCIHIEGGNRPFSSDHRYYKWEDEMRETLFAGLDNVHIGGHF